MNTFPFTTHLRSAFRKIGADVRVVAPLRSARRTWIPAASAAALAAQRIRVRDDMFELVLPATASATVLDCRKDERHLVVSVQDAGAASQKFLCGFDERHWFAAAVTGNTVPAAKASLLPAPVRAHALRTGIRHAHLFRRHNQAFIRQGEWFFVPTDETMHRLTIRYREPLIRPGGGKPHIVDELVRSRGEMVWHHPQHAPHGFTDEEYRALPEPFRRMKAWTRRTRIGQRGEVYVRGAVRHPDHATIHLNGWHRVYINSEQRSDSLGFLD